LGTVHGRKRGFWDGHYIYIFIYLFIWKSVDVYTGYVVTDREENMNIGQYYSS